MTILDIVVLGVAIAVVAFVLAFYGRKRKREPFEMGGGNIIFGNDLPGNPVGGIKDAVSCARTCKDTPGCAYYTWLGPGSPIPNTCWLKSKEGEGRTMKWNDSYTGKPDELPKTPDAVAGCQPYVETPENPILDFHNKMRAKHGACPLIWDEGLASEARTHVDSCIYSHGGNAPGHGQNIADVWRDELQGPELWYSEVDAVRAVRDNPNLYFDAGGHFTAMVWKSTTHLGCASKKCGDRIIQACHYRPAGNMLGEYATNVSV